MSKKKKEQQSLERILIVPDCHFPYHDKRAWELMLQVGQSLKPDHIISLGDFADFFAVSSHSKDPTRALKLQEEIDEAKRGLDQLIDLGAKNNVFIAGNHCDRLTRYLQDKAPELYNFISIPKILDLEAKGFKYVPYKQSYAIGKLNLTHDTGTAGKYAHYKALDTFQHNVVIGHTHRMGYAVEGNAQGERHVTAMLGWLGNVEEVDYMHRVKAMKEWSLGFGIAYLNPETGIVYLQPIPIVGYTCCVDGILYKG